MPGVKAVAVFAGLPNCAVLGRPELVPQRMSEEHLTLQAPAGAALPEIGEILYLIPRHAGLTVNNFRRGAGRLFRWQRRSSSASRHAGASLPRLSAVDFVIPSAERKNMIARICTYGAVALAIAAAPLMMGSPKADSDRVAAERSAEDRRKARSRAG